jgi:inner membrane protein
VPTIFSHAVATVTIGAAVLPRGIGVKPWLIGVGCAIAADLDVIGLFLGVPYGHLFGHRGLTHSLLFALILAPVLLWTFYRESRWARYRPRLFLFLLLSAVLHGMLDALTNGGLGVAFFSPFSNARYFFPITPIEVSPIGAGFFSEHGLSTLRSEMWWIWLPCALVCVVTLLIRRPTSGSF